MFYTTSLELGLSKQLQLEKVIKDQELTEVLYQVKSFSVIDKSFENSVPIP